MEQCKKFHNCLAIQLNCENILGCHWWCTLCNWEEIINGHQGMTNVKIQRWHKYITLFSDKFVFSLTALFVLSCLFFHVSYFIGFSCLMSCVCKRGEDYTSHIFIYWFAFSACYGLWIYSYFFIMREQLLWWRNIAISSVIS